MPKLVRSMTISLLIALCFGAFPAAAADVEWVADELLVRFKDDTDHELIDGIFAALGGTVIGRFRGDGNLFQLRIPAGANLDSVIAAYAARPEVSYAQKNLIYRTTIIPNDTRFGELWGMHNTGQSGGTVDADVDAPEAWDIFTGQFSLVVATIDTGVWYGHEDLSANIWTNPGEIPGNGIDDDANGFIDDIHGYDFVNNDGDPIDDHDHGTHVSGTFGGVGDNGVGVAGANWSLQIMAVKFLNAGGSGSTANAIRAVDYATENGARISNNSWGGGGNDQGLKDAIDRANAAGSLFIAAAGNANTNVDNSPFYPCSYGAPGANESVNVICVAATDRNDARASFSNFGATTVDLGGPGVSTLSTVRNNGYSSFSGTSMATPHVVGGAALVEGCKSTLGHLDVKNIVLDTVRPVSSLSGITVTGGVVNYRNALDDPRVGACDQPGPNNPPTANPNGPYIGHRNRPLQFDGSGSSDTDGSIAAYSWNFGDGTFGSGQTPTHIYAWGGSYTVTLRVRDNLGAWSAAVSTTATIRGRRLR